MPHQRPVPHRLRPKPRRHDLALTAAAASYTPTEYRSSVGYLSQSWQQEAWIFYDSQGEFGEAVDWQARAMSRIHLHAAEVTAEGPQILDEGPAAELMVAFCGGAPGHAAFLAAITPHLKVPGEGWLVVERSDPRIPLAAADWCVYSSDCIQPRGDAYWVQTGPGQWRPLAGQRLANGTITAGDMLPMRIYQPAPRYAWLARSSALAAIPILRRIDLIDKRIIAMMVSRLAMNGFLLIPQEGTFSVPEQFQDAPDPFVAQMLDFAARGIRDPGSASAAIPFPIKFTANLIEKWRLLKPEDPLDEWLLKARTDELGRLGDSLNISRERVTGGVGTLNHWNAWQVSEEEVRLTFAPTAELICGALTKAYLQPALKSLGLPLLGPEGGPLVVWYDPVELTVRPDLSAAALNLYDRGELSGVALRRESGFSEADTNDPEQLAGWAWRTVLKDPNLAAEALKQLIGAVVAQPQAPVAGQVPAPGPVPGAPPASPGEANAVPATGPPATKAVAPPAPGMSASYRSRVLVSAGVGAEEANGHGRR